LINICPKPSSAKTAVAVARWGEDRRRVRLERDLADVAGEAAEGLDPARPPFDFRQFLNAFVARHGGYDGAS
jgi:hypothetical protein